VYLNVSHNALGMIGGRSLLRVKRSKLELLQHQCSTEVFLFDDPFLPKPVAAVPSASLPREFKLVGVVAIPRMPIGFKKGDVVVDMSRCSIDSIGAITPDLLNMDNPNNRYELDLANIRDRWRIAARALCTHSLTHSHDFRAIASELWEFAMREPGENWVGETVDNIKIEISEDPDNPWIIPLRGILRVTYVSFPKPPTDENAIQNYVLDDLMMKISRSTVGPSVSGKDRLEIIVSVASETFFSSSNIAKLLKEFDERTDRINLILRVFDRCTDFQNKKVFLNAMSDEERRLVAKTLGQLYSFQPGFPAGHYTLDLSNRFDRLLATKLQEESNLQNEKANQLGLLDSGQFGNGERCWRNVTINGKEVQYVLKSFATLCHLFLFQVVRVHVCRSPRVCCRFNGRFQLPATGAMTMDIVSIASSFAKDGRATGSNELVMFARAEFEEFIAALKESIDSAASHQAREQALLAAVETIRSRLLSGKMLTCKMVMRLRALFFF
jgi:hypothetical protein